MQINNRNDDQVIHNIKRGISMHLSTLSEWMSFIGSLHSKEMELGLERIKIVAQRLKVLTSGNTIIVVGGTNGKGSTVAGLESIYRAQGYQTGTFTSPILFKQNEQVRINNKMAADEEFCSAFAQVESARQTVALTPFEFCTLAALCIFKKYPLDVLILEVGLGGRLDAVNIVEPHISVVTSIGIDHINWLGNTREQIAFEKAGIFRYKKPAVCGDFDPPASLIQMAVDKQSHLYCQGRDFNFEETSPTSWSWRNDNIHYENLPKNRLALQNMSTVLMTITLLNSRLPVSRDAIEKGLKNVYLPARIEIFEGEITEIFDVSHNPDAIKFLSDKLKTLSHSGKTLAVFSMLADKDIVSSIHAIKNNIDTWYAAPLQTKRAANQAMLQTAFQEASVEKVNFYADIKNAYQAAKKNAVTGDRIIVFGSFHTVAETAGFNGAFDN
jgi:dihydrofolate synthase / folylpolyglutamate synthase